MARLTIEQVNAPDFSASSAMLARAGESFNTGIESARGILGKYNEGQQAKDDLLAITEIAKQRDEAGLDNLLASDFFTGLNLSDTMRENLATVRSDVIGNVNDRDSNSRANATEGRTAAEYVDGVAARTERRGMTGAAVAAYNEGQRYGTGGRAASELAAAGGGAIRYSNSGATRSQPLAENLSTGLNSVLPELGLGFEVTSGGQDEAGTPNARRVGDTTNHDNGHAGDGYFYDLQTGERINPDTDERAWEAVTRLTAAGVGGIGNGEGYMEDGMFHLGNTNGDRIWGADYGSDSADPRLAAAWERGIAMRNGATPDPRLNPITENPLGGAAYSNFSDAVAQSLYMDPDAAISLLGGSLTAQREGQANILAADQLRQSELSSEATRNAIVDPNNLSEASIRRDLMSIPGVNAAGQLAAAGQDLAPYGEIIRPTVAPDAEVDAALERTQAADDRGSSIDELGRSFELAKMFDDSDDVAASVIEQMNIPEDVTVDTNQINRQMQRMADAANVTVGEMAVSIESISQGNFSEFMEMVSSHPDQDMYDSVMNVARNRFGEDARSEYDESQDTASRRVAERNSIQLQYDTLRTQIQKESDPVRREILTREAGELRATIMANMTPAERATNLRDYVARTGMASRLQIAQEALARDPEDPSFDEAMADLETEIIRDPNLSNQEKELLLRDVRG